jgi:ATP/maltotriose-dependent transcriptional regulator MalT
VVLPSASPQPLAPSPPSVLDGLTALVDASLLRPSTEPVDDEPRFGLLETVREFGIERLEESGEAEAVRAAHAAYFLALAEQAEAERTGAVRRGRAARLGEERGNMLAALRWLRERGDVERGLRLAAGLWPLWLEHGDLAEGRAQLADLLTPPGAKAHRSAWARAAGVAAALAQAQGDHDEAAAWGERALAACTELADDRGQAVARTTLGLDALVRGDFAGAEAHLEASRTLFRAVDDVRAGTWSLRHLGSLAHRRGDPVRAAALAEDGLGLVRSTGSAVDAARLLHTLGVAKATQGCWTEAADRWREALALYRQAGDRWGIADALGSLGEDAHERGDLDEAGALLEESLALFREVGDPEGVAFGLGRLAWLARSRGDLASAARLLEEGLGLARERQERPCAEGLLLGLVTVRLEQGDPPAAAALLGEAAGEPADTSFEIEIPSAAGEAADRPSAAARLLEAVRALRVGNGVPPTRIERQATERVATLLSPQRDDPSFGGQDPAPPRQPVGADRITAREADVLRLLAEGYSDKEIAVALAVSYRTVTSHVGSILAKLEVESRTRAATLAVRLGLAGDVPAGGQGDARPAPKTPLRGSSDAGSPDAV